MQLDLLQDGDVEDLEGISGAIDNSDVDDSDLDESKTGIYCCICCSLELSCHLANYVQ